MLFACGVILGWGPPQINQCVNLEVLILNYMDLDDISMLSLPKLRCVLSCCRVFVESLSRFCLFGVSFVCLPMFLCLLLSRRAPPPTHTQLCGPAL